MRSAGGATRSALIAPMVSYLGCLVTPLAVDGLPGLEGITGLPAMRRGEERDEKGMGWVVR